MKDGSYLVKTDNYKFELNINKYSDEYIIDYGDPKNREGPCVSLTYNINKNTIIKLSYLSYYARCSKDNDLLKGSGTQEMLQSILKLCIEFEPTIKRVIFNDVSNFECDSETILLSIYYILLYGDTWYENKFGAKYSDKSQRAALQKFKDFLKTKPKSGVFSFYDKNIKARTWHEYFTIIKDTIGCSFLIDNKREIESIARIKFEYSEWYIPVRKILKYNISTHMHKIKSGGDFIHKYKSMNFTEEDILL